MTDTPVTPTGPRQDDESGDQYLLRSLAAGENLEILDGHLVLRGAQEPDYPAGPEYGPYPYSDAAEILDLRGVPGFTLPEPPTSEHAISVASIADDHDRIWVTTPYNRRRIHREDADPEHRHVEYRMAATWFGNAAQ